MPPVGMPHSNTLFILLRCAPPSCVNHFVLHDKAHGDLTVLPQVIQLRCDSLRSMQLADCQTFISYTHNE
jgi:hypothetical protein